MPQQKDCHSLIFGEHSHSSGILKQALDTHHGSPSGSLFTANCQYDTKATPVTHRLTTRSTQFNANPQNRAIIEQRHYLKVERLFHPGPWKETLRHHKDRSSQYVDLAVGDHPEYTGERVFHINRLASFTEQAAMSAYYQTEAPIGSKARKLLFSLVRLNRRDTGLCRCLYPLQQLLINQSNIPRTCEKCRFKAQAHRVGLHIERFLDFRSSTKLSKRVSNLIYAHNLR